MSEQKENFLDEFAGQGYDNLSSEDYQIPFVKILQSQSTQCNVDVSEDYIEGAKPGMFYNTITNKLYGDTMRLIPVNFEKVWIEWKKDRGGFIDRHEPNSFVPDKTDFSNWTNEVGNTITEYYNFFCVIADCPEDGIVVVSMSGSTIKQAKSWNSQISYTRLPDGKQAPYFSSIWELKTAFFQNDKGTWYSVGNVKRINFIDKKIFIGFVSPAKHSLDSSKVDYQQLT